MPLKAYSQKDSIKLTTTTAICLKTKNMSVQYSSPVVQSSD